MQGATLRSIEPPKVALPGNGASLSRQFYASRFDGSGI